MQQTIQVLTWLSFLLLVLPSVVRAQDDSVVRIAVLSDELTPATLLINGEVTGSISDAFSVSNIQIAQGEVTLGFRLNDDTVIESVSALPLVAGQEYLALLTMLPEGPRVIVAFDDNSDVEDGFERVRGFHAHPEASTATVYKSDGSFNQLGLLLGDLPPGGASLYELVDSTLEYISVDLTRDGIADALFRYEYGAFANARGNLFISEKDGVATVFVIEGDGSHRELVAVQDPKPTPTPTPTPTPGPVGDVSYEFDEGPEGWTFAAPAGFIAPIGGYTTGTLEIQTLSSVDTFGWWESPVQEVTRRAIAGDILYRFQARISSDQDDVSLVPEVRLRLWQEGFATTDAMSISSSGGGEYSPGIDGRLYSHWVEMPGEVSLQMSFDVLSFDSSNASQATIRLEGAALQAFSSADLTENVELARFDFRNGRANGFGAGGAPPFLAPDFSVSPFGLAQSAVIETPPATVFGYWTRNTGIPFEPGRLYSATYSIASSANESEAVRLPAFRLRQNETGFQLSLSKNVESVGDSPLPTQQRPLSYSLFFETPDDFVDRRWIPSLDYLLIEGSGNDGRLKLYLEELTFSSWLIPGSEEVSR